MKEHLRVSGIEAIGDIVWGTHLCQLYQTREELVDTLVPYFKAGLKNSEACLWIISEYLAENEAKERRTIIPDLEGFIKQGQIEIISYNQFYFEDGNCNSKKALKYLSERLGNAIKKGYTGLRFAEDTGWLEKKDWDFFVDFEKKMDEITGNNRMIALCAYSLKKCSASEIIDTVMNHKSVLIKKEEQWKLIESPKRKEIEQALVRSENEFRTLAENSPDVIVRFDKERRYLYANPAAAEPYGLPPEKLIGKTNLDLPIDPGLVRFWRAHYGQVFATGKIEKMEFHCTSPKGREYYFDTRIVPEFSDGEIVSVLAISRDITEIKKAQMKLKEMLENLEGLVKERTLQLEKTCYLLKESERDLAEAQRMGHIGNWKWNIFTGEICWSDEVYRIFGHNPQDFKLDYHTFFKYIHPEDRSSVIEAIKKGMRGKAVGIDYRIIRDNGEERIVYTEAEIIFNKERNPLRAKGIIQDITERKKAEQALRFSSIYNRSLIEASLDPLVTIGPDGKITDVNSATERVTGYSRSELIGTDFSDYFTEPEEARKGYQQVFIYGKVRDYPLEVQHRDGHTTPVLYNASLYKSEKGEVIGIFAAARDITELKEVKEILKLKLGELARKKEIHHRIKNNLQVISSLLDLQAEKFEGREYFRDSEILEAFRESQDRVASIALIHEELHEGGENDTLNFSQYLEKLAENLFQTYMFGNNIELKMNLAENVFFDMDIAVPLGIIVNELISNSLKHAFPDCRKGKIQIILTRHERNHGKSKNDFNGRQKKVQVTKFTLEVLDNGIGIPGALDIENSGSLGLQLISILVDQLDGKLELKRENGTRFIIQIDVKEN